MSKIEDIIGIYAGEMAPVIVDKLKEAGYLILHTDELLERHNASFDNGADVMREIVQDRNTRPI